jgi:hypothetical protein
MAELEDMDEMNDPEEAPALSHSFSSSSENEDEDGEAGRRGFFDNPTGGGGRESCVTSRMRSRTSMIRIGDLIFGDLR